MGNELVIPTDAELDELFQDGDVREVHSYLAAIAEPDRDPDEESAS